MKISADGPPPLFPTDEGILQPSGNSALRMERFAPPAALASCVDHFWIAEWTAPPKEPLVLDIVAMPCVNLVLSNEAALVAGVKTARHQLQLAGSGRVAGLRFKPGGFRPFYAQPVSRLRDREEPATTLALEMNRAWAQAIVAEADFGKAALAVFESIGALPRLREPRADLIESILRLCWEQPALSVAEIAQMQGLRLRTLEALFHDDVGASLVWIRRQIRALSAMRLAGTTEGWADIAQQLGYSDQAHLTNQFRTATGMPPGTFFRRGR